MIKVLSALTILVCCCSTTRAQERALDKYLGRSAVLTTIAGSQDMIESPQDLDFCRVPGREDELWVLNKGDEYGGSMVILFNAGKENQTSQYRFDSHAGHFMLNPSAIAMAANGNFGTTAEILNTNGSSWSTFMGPTLWNSDTSIFARVHQNDWIPGELLGSHSDMLHESPFSMGIAADTGNVYWVFSGHYGAIVRFDFAEPHGYGEDDHSDGLVRQFDVPVKRVAGLPAHMILDQATGWLYIVDNGNKRLIRMQTLSGTPGEDLEMENELLVEYLQMDNVVWETIDSNLNRASGIDLFDGRLVVSNNTTGRLRFYSTETEKPTYLGEIHTGDAGIMGVKVAPDGTIWYVNNSKDKVVRVTPGELLASVEETGDEADVAVFPNPAQSQITISTEEDVKSIEILNSLGAVVRSLASTEGSVSVNVEDLPNGVYHIVIRNEGSHTIERFVISR